VSVGEIVKSLVFVADDRPIVVLCCGDRRVSEDRLRELVGASALRRTTADEAKRFTGYAIGGVPPFAHETACETVIDEDMSRFEKVWAAAGLPDAVFEIAVADLRRLSDAENARIAE
jgi:prolyl-tRNA editing enzyme YbaK/EbsC (Cys-tRNA(Pro) deacylase)